MTVRRWTISLLVALGAFVSGCGSPTSAQAPTQATQEPNPLTIPLEGLDHAKSSLSYVSGDASLVVVEFFSHHCPCQAAHDQRMKDLYETYRTKGVSFVLVDSEAGATVARDREESSKRGYAFPLLLDPGARLATRLGAEFATHAVILDRSTGAILYRGGIDSDHSHLTDDATPFLKDALDDLISKKAVRKTDTKPLGCVLRRST